MGRGRGRGSRPRPGQASPGSRGLELHRRLSPDRALQAGAAVHPRDGGRRSRRKRGARRHGHEARRPRRLRRSDRRLCARASDRRGSPGEAAESHFVRAGGGDDAPGDDRAHAASGSASRRAGRDDPHPCRRGRRRPHRLPMGKSPGRDRHRHGFKRREGRARARPRLRSSDRLHPAGFRRRGRADHGRQEAAGRL